jgi:hypothetical protein
VTPRILASSDVMAMIKERVARQRGGLVTADYETTLRSLARFHNRLLSLERWYKKQGRQYAHSEITHKS